MYINNLLTLTLQMMGEDLSAKEPTRMGKVMKAAIANIVPRSQREDFMANYNCKPPPIFMIVISIAEV